MSRRWRWLLSGFAGLVVVGAIGLVLMLSSDWLRQKIQFAIVESTQKATGGRVEISGFRYDWLNLTAQLDRFAIHGLEPTGAAPLVETGPIRVELQIVSLLELQIRPATLQVTQPRVHLIVQPDGSTNLPKPKTQGGKSAAETIVDLKIGKVSLQDGTLTLDAPGRPAKQLPLDVNAEGLRALFTFELARARYSGEMSLAKVRWNGLEIEAATEAVLERNRATFRKASVKTKHSTLLLAEASVESLAAPELHAKWDAQIALEDWSRQAKGTVHGSGDARLQSISDYDVTGKLDAGGLAVNRVRNIRASAEMTAKPGLVNLKDLRASLLGGDFTGTAELRDFDRIKVAGKASRFRLAQVMATLGGAALPYDAMVSGQVAAEGPINRLKARGQLAVEPVKGGAAVRGMVAVNYDPAGGKVDLGQSWLELPHSRVEVSGILGDKLSVHATSTDIADLLPAFGGKAPQARYGSLAFTGTVMGPLASPEVVGAARVEKFVSGDLELDSAAGDVTISATQFRANRMEVMRGGVRGLISGTAGLSEWSFGKTSPLAARVTGSEIDFRQVLALLGHEEVRVTGRLSGDVDVSGTIADPHATGDVTLVRGDIYDQPFDSMTGRLQVVNASVQTISGLFISGPKRVNLSGRFEHAGTQFPAGTLEFNLTSNTMPLNQISLVRQRQPNIQGFGKFHADGALKISHDSKHELQAELTALNGDASANGVELEGRNLGDSRLTVTTKGSTVSGHFESNAANAAIRGDGTMQLGGDYPLSGTFRFDNASLNAMTALALKAEDSRKLTFDGSVQAEVKLTGPARRPEELRAEVDIGRLELRALPGSEIAASMPGYVLTNDGPIRFAVTRSQAKIESARLKGPETQLTASGTVAFTGDAPLNAQLRGTVNLALIHQFAPEVTAGGSISLDATMKGSFATPDFTGKAQLRNGEAHYAGFANGLTNANGEITFNGTRATIQTLSAETGGGRVDASGFAALSNGVVAFRIDAKAREVRVRYPEGVSSVSDVALTLAGTSQRSLASGSITVHRVTINPRSDAATLLALSAQPLQTASARTGFLGNMNLDVQIATAPDVVMQTSLTESLQADANLRLRGTVTNPAILGRINVTHGELIFFGNKYSISQGAISFFNPTKIEPIVNFDLETRARGVDVILTVAGQVNKLNVSYRSDPPLQFSEIVALLATGRTPTDATLAARDTGQSQSLQDLGASALIGQAIANPVAGRLQRFFGVSRLKIDPRLTGITGSPQARLTLEQQITPDILFTYVTDVSNTSTQLIRVEWTMNQNWSALLTREENGKVGLDFSFKKRFK